MATRLCTGEAVPSTERRLRIALPAKGDTEAPRNKHRCWTRARVLPVPVCTTGQAGLWTVPLGAGGGGGGLWGLTRLQLDG